MSDADTVQPNLATVAVVLCAIVGLVLVSAALPPMIGEGVTTETDSQLDDELPEEPAADDQPEEETSESSTDETDDGSPYELSVRSSGVPGTQATIQVTYEGDPVVDVPILFDGEFVGSTDETGALETTVPFADSVEITANVEGGDVVASGASTTTAADEELSTTLDTDGELAVELSGNVHPGGDADVRVTIGGVSVEDATVVVGDRMSTTDENGATTASIGEDVDELTVEAERGEFTVNEQVSLPLDIETSVAPRFGLPYAFGSASVVVSPVDDDVVSSYDGGTVYLLDEAVEEPTAADLENAQTTAPLDGSGTSLRLPVSSDATIVVDAAGDREVVVLNDLLRNLGIVVLGGTSLGFGFAITYGRVLNRSLRRDLTFAGRSFTIGALGFGSVLYRLGTTYNPIPALRRAVGGIAVGTVGLAGALVSLHLPRLPSLSLPSLSLSAPSTPSLGLGSALSRAGGDEEQTGGAADDSHIPIGEYDAAAPDLGDVSEPDNRERVRAVWHEFAETAGVGSVETTTPGAAARRARETGLPAPAIEAITQVFRAVEYGRAPVTDDRTERALRALAAIRTHDGGEQE